MLLFFSTTATGAPVLTAISTNARCFCCTRGSLVFEDSRRMTTKEYQDHRPILRRLARYYDTVEKEKLLDSIKRQAELAKKLQKERQAGAVKNCIPSDEDSDENENIMPQETGQDKEPASSSKEQPYEDEQNIMPDAKDQDQEVDLEEMMDTEHSQDPSASSSEETDSESSSSTSTSYIDLLNSSMRSGVPNGCSFKKT